MGGTQDWSCKKAGAPASAKRTCYCCLSPNFEYCSHLIANFVISEYVLKHSVLNLSSFFKKNNHCLLETSTNPVLSEEWPFVGMHNSQKHEVSPHPGPGRQGGYFCGADIAAAAAAGASEQTKLCSFSAPAERAGGGGRDRRRMSLGMEVAQSNEEKWNERRQCTFRFIKKYFQ